jgi:hypothetical protein
MIDLTKPFRNVLYKGDKVFFWDYNAEYGEYSCLILIPDKEYPKRGEFKFVYSEELEEIK